MKVATVFLVSLLSGCFSVPSGTTKPTNVDDIDKNNPNLQLYVGEYTYGFEASSFQACNGSKAFWVNGYSDDMDIIYKASLAKADRVGQPYQPIYVEFMGKPSAAEPVGFEEDYDGVLILNKLVRFSYDVPLDC